MTAPHPRAVEVFRQVRQDARSDPKPTEGVWPITILFTFDGARLPPTVGDRVVIPLGKVTARIMGAVMTTDSDGDATVDISISSVTSWPTGSKIYDTVPLISGTGPTAVELDVTAWKVNLQPGDILVAILNSVSGTITTVTLALECVRIKWPSGIATVTDDSGNILVDSDNNSIVQRP